MSPHPGGRIKPEERHPFEWAGETRTGPAGRTYRVCAVCGRANIGMTHTQKGQGRQSRRNPGRVGALDRIGALGVFPGRTGDDSARSAAIRPRLTMSEGDERPEKVVPDWRLFAAYHAIVHAEEVRDLDAGLEHALKVAARELDFLLHRRGVAVAKPATHIPSAPKVDHVGAVLTLPRFRDSDLRDIAALAARQGFTWKVDGAGHMRMTGPDGRWFIVSTTALGSHARTLKNVKADARRAGVAVP